MEFSLNKFKEKIQIFINFLSRKLFNGNLNISEDVVSETIFTCVSSCALKIDEENFPCPKFQNCLMNRAINEQNRRKRIINFSEVYNNGFEPIEVSDDNSAANAIINGLTKKNLYKYLNEDEIRLLNLRFDEDNNFDEIGIKLGISQNAAKKRFYKIINYLKNLLYNK